jgi:hypothetical protein
MGTNTVALEAALAQCDAAGLGMPFMAWKHGVPEDGQRGERLLRVVHVIRELRNRL